MCPLRENSYSAGWERAADTEDWDALGTSGPEGSCCSHQLIKEEPEIQIFFFKHWLHFFKQMVGKIKQVYGLTSALSFPAGVGTAYFSVDLCCYLVVDWGR